MKTLFLSLAVGLSILFPLIAFTELNGFVAGAISLGLANLAGNWFSRYLAGEQESE